MNSRINKNKSVIKKIEYTKKLKIIIFILTIILSIIFSLFYLGNQGIIVNEKRIVSTKIPVEFNGIKLIHISNLKFYKMNNKMKKLINIVKEINPDIILYSGDLFINGYKKEDLNKLLSSLDAKLIKYFIGDDEESLLTKNNFININNKLDKIYNGNDNYINIIGIKDYNKINFLNLNDRYTIALIGKADDFDQISKQNINIAFSDGQGGIIKIPFTDIGLFKMNNNKKYLNDYYNINNIKYFLNSGINNKYLPIRLFNKPSITLIRLANKN